MSSIERLARLLEEQWPGMLSWTTSSVIAARTASCSQLVCRCAVCLVESVSVASEQCTAVCLSVGLSACKDEPVSCDCLSGVRIHHTSKQVINADLLKPWEVSRQMYKQRKAAVGHREKDTLAKLKAFSDKVQAAAVAEEPPRADQAHKVQS
jgi:hypothetical protein